jgi:hypothetical protein
MGAACSDCIIRLVTSAQMTSSASAAWEMRLQEQAALVDKYMLMATCGTEKQRRSAYGLYRKHEQIYDLMLTNYSTRQVHDRLKKVAPFLKAGASANMDRYAYVHIHKVGLNLLTFFY